MTDEILLNIGACGDMCGSPHQDDGDSRVYHECCSHVAQEIELLRRQRDLALAALRRNLHRQAQLRHDSTTDPQAQLGTAFVEIDRLRAENKRLRLERDETQEVFKMRDKATLLQMEAIVQLQRQRDLALKLMRERWPWVAENWQGAAISLAEGQRDKILDAIEKEVLEEPDNCKCIESPHSGAPGSSTKETEEP